ncbi:Tyrosine-protein kinase receptor Tie-2 [Holothuria leucospilota]|uniref:Tyrosine-protein kinase receptor Tie-2 n=1 Tax=Holothuria leucospilota TaxID=206669 RepID=A0A9Q1C8S0_HOLLE|nr:Tyrosine-protein kinase receptor Tie-2 [Holothuria leucospilota]
MVTSHPFNAGSRNPYPEYYCYLNSPDADAIVTARRVWGTRTNSESINNNPPPPSPHRGSDGPYPAGSAVYNVSLSFSRNTQSYAFGTFSCSASKIGRKFTTVSNILMTSDVYSWPADGLVTQTVNTGDTGVQIRMRLSSRRSVRRWYRNEASYLFPTTESAARGTLSFTTVQKYQHEGVYEAVTDFTSRPRGQPRHGLKRLIVCSCRGGRWGPPGCNGMCDECYNGGVCDDETGKCICPPGFMGTNCLTACGGNRFGYSCEFQCSYDGDDEDACSGLQFCLLDPFGCRCNTGWKGLGCNDACSEGTFGASCLQECHCDGLCDRFTGVCNGTCDAGLSGDSCQMECSGGYFGKSCLQECRCASHACNIVTGDCSGQCKPQWVDAYQCLAGVENVTSSKANPNGTSEVRCVTQVHRDSSSTLTVYLSRQSDHLERTGIELMEKISNASTETWIFTADNVRAGDKLYCLVFDQSNITVAMLHTTVIEYDLPVFNSSSPTLVSATKTSITIRWRSWDPDRDYGDPPVVAYIPYYRKAVSEEWISGTAVSPGEETLEFMADNLEADTEYSFSVAVVREGVNGAGPRGPPANLRTSCDDVVPQNVIAYMDERTKQVNISWQIPDNIMCTSGIFFFFIYYKIEGTNQEPQFLTKAEGDVTWITVNTQMLGVGEFGFYVTLVIDEESALSERSEQLVITQQGIIIMHTSV